MGFMIPVVQAVGGFFTSGGLGGALKAGGALLSGVQAFQTASYQSSVAKMNAQIADENAARARQRATLAAQENDLATVGMLGEQLSVQAASGLSTGSRSAMMTRKATRQRGRLDSLNIIQGGDVEAYNYKTQAANFRSDAKASSLDAAGGLLGGVMKAGSLISNASSTRNPSRFDRRPVPRQRNLLT